MFNALKGYIKNKKKLNRKARQVVNQDTIECHLKLNRGDSLSYFSTKESPTPNQELIEYIDEQVSCISHKNNLKFVVHTSKQNPVQPEEFENLLDRYYETQVVKSHIESKSLTFQGIVMLIVGLLIFTSYVLLKVYVTQSLWLELIDILAWVFVWESVDLIFLAQYGIKQKKAHCNKVVNAQIEIKIDK